MVNRLLTRVRGLIVVIAVCNDQLPARPIRHARVAWVCQLALGVPTGHDQWGKPQHLGVPQFLVMAKPM